MRDDDDDVGGEQEQEPSSLASFTQLTINIRFPTTKGTYPGTVSLTTTRTVAAPIEYRPCDYWNSIPPLFPLGRPEAAPSANRRVIPVQLSHCLSQRLRTYSPRLEDHHQATTPPAPRISKATTQTTSDKRAAPSNKPSPVLRTQKTSAVKQDAAIIRRRVSTVLYSSESADLCVSQTFLIPPSEQEQVQVHPPRFETSECEWFIFLDCGCTKQSQDPAACMRNRG